MTATNAGSGDRARTALNDWLRARAAGWADLGNRMARLRGGRPIAVGEALELASTYRRIGHDLSLARQLAAPSSTTTFLAQLYADLHQVLTQPVGRPSETLRTLLRNEVPAAIRSMRTRILLVTILFLSAAAAGWILVAINPQLVSLVASPAMIEEVEGGGLWTDGLLNIVPPAVLSASIFTNNIVVALTACCIGALFGLGTFYIIGFNGFMLGAIFAFVGQHHMAMRLFEFVVAHGIVELSVIVVSGAAGITLGEALIRPGIRSRRRAFELAARRATGVMLVCIAFLVGAGLIEGHVSPNPTYPLTARLVIGTSYMFLFVVTISGAGWRKSIG